MRSCWGHEWWRLLHARARSDAATEVTCCCRWGCVSSKSRGCRSTASQARRSSYRRLFSWVVVIIVVFLPQCRRCKRMRAVVCPHGLDGGRARPSGAQTHVLSGRVAIELTRQRLFTRARSADCSAQALFARCSGHGRIAVRKHERDMGLCSGRPRRAAAEGGWRATGRRGGAHGGAY